MIFFFFFDALKILLKVYFFVKCLGHIYSKWMLLGFSWFFSLCFCAEGEQREAGGHIKEDKGFKY